MLDHRWQHNLLSAQSRVKRFSHQPFYFFNNCNISSTVGLGRLRDTFLVVGGCTKVTYMFYSRIYSWMMNCVYGSDGLMAETFTFTFSFRFRIRIWILFLLKFCSLYTELPKINKQNYFYYNIIYIYIYNRFCASLYKLLNI